jgi:1,4-alpha-glucan branching enzyme
MYSIWVHSQTVTTNPSIPTPSEPVTITFDVAGTDFATKNLNDVWLWAWLENGSNDVNAPTNVNPATDAQDAAKVTRSSTNSNIYTITITATQFFNRPANEINEAGLLLKGRNWTDGQTADRFINFTLSFTVTFSQPASQQLFVDVNESIDMEVSTNEPASISLKIAGNTIASSGGLVTSLNYTHVVTELEGTVEVICEADNGIEVISDAFTYIIRSPTVEASRPAGIIDGINYHTDPTKVTLGLWAPGKSSVFVVGDFTDWTIDSQYQMKKDGEHFWLEIQELTSGVEYAFQYLVDENIFIADPYADKILDPDDQYISQTTYPGLKSYPSGALHDQWYYNRLSVLQTAQQPYTWAVASFEKPIKENLVIYELLVRDFFESGDRNYQNLIDTLGYLKGLGITAIELMPIMEFNGNESWGYNPTFMFAPDKYYGTKNKLKEFIDKCHMNEMAVILDIALNHQDIPNPYAVMDFDFVNYKPAASNKWFNVNPTHPFNVFYDMNHESAYTKAYIDTINHYWLNEFKVDGFRFDLSKGFTQTNNPSNVSAWSAYDASRVALLKRMADKIWEHSPDAYIVLEHLAVNIEEKELSEYRAGEGKGMMLWGKMTDAYNQNTMGYEENSDISGILHTTRGWNQPHLVGYMESHDEERLMFKNIEYGNSSGTYDVKTLATGLSRQRAASTIFYTLPGPKMLWQFGELGYDFSINHCPDGSNNPDCRVSPKPVKWDYRDDFLRYQLYQHTADLIRLRNTFDVFTSGTPTLTGGAGLAKQLMLTNNPYNPSPVDASEMNALVVVNFDVEMKVVAVDFPHAGTWFDYYLNGAMVDVTSGAYNLSLLPGQYKLFTDVQIENSIVTGIEKSSTTGLPVYPNPASDLIMVAAEDVLALCIISLQGLEINPPRLSQNSWYVGDIKSGLYVVSIETPKGIYRVKIIKE